MIRHSGALLALIALAAWGASPASAGDAKGPTELVHVPTEEMDVLLRADSQGIVLKYAEYQRLLKAAKARAAALEAQPPVDGTLVSCTGAIDLTPERAATMDLSYGVEVLADGPRSVDFPLRGFAIERLLIQDPEGTPSGRYEELEDFFVMDCVECGSCSFACPSGIPIVHLIRVAKSAIREGKRKAAAS